MSPNPTNTQLDYPDRETVAALLAFAENNGATRAARLPPAAIHIENRLAAYCRDPKCPHYGLSMSCPPHIPGPSGLRKIVAESRHAIVIRIEVDAASLTGEQRPEVMRVLHETVATIEREAKRLDFNEPRAFAGGSCKMSFCAHHEQCLVLSGEGPCRYPESARPSMSGYGVNVGELMKEAGWPVDLFPAQDETNGEQLSWVAGLVLLR